MFFEGLFSFLCFFFSPRFAPKSNKLPTVEGYQVFGVVQRRGKTRSVYAVLWALGYYYTTGVVVVFVVRRTSRNGGGMSFLLGHVFRPEKIPRTLRVSSGQVTGCPFYLDKKERKSYQTDTKSIDI